MQEKRFVKVRADFTLDGRVVPLKFRTEDGPAFVIDRIVDIRPAPSLKSGGQGMRYTCRVGDRMLFLFHDRTHWFVESVDQA
ncbi:MAG: hypothetical protein IKH77_00305 [Clostridia bacterium]|nr:hypothetical protein [Clostridia bacterium]